ncbi:hypothetical protein A2U01_0026077, partial [Trifolium medium]|nr:hypothetical protein [Trifolium medium]
QEVERQNKEVDVCLEPTCYDREKCKHYVFGVCGNFYHAYAEHSVNCHEMGHLPCGLLHND